MQNKVLKIIYKDNFVTKNFLCSLDQQFSLKTLMHRTLWNFQKKRFFESKSKTIRDNF